MKLAGYIRVSTDAQADGYGLEVQKASIYRWAKANRHRIVEIHGDEGISGSKDIDARGGLHAALQSIQDGQVQGIVVYKLDRLARALTVQESCLAQVWKSNGTVFACDIGEVQADDPMDPMRTAMRQMIGCWAQLERGMIASRMRAGRLAKAERGGFIGGSPAFGLAAKDRELVVDASESETAHRITALHKQGNSYRAIATLLDAEGRRPKRGGHWHPFAVARVVDRSRLQNKSAVSTRKDQVNVNN